MSFSLFIPHFAVGRLPLCSKFLIPRLALLFFRPSVTRYIVLGLPSPSFRFPIHDMLQSCSVRTWGPYVFARADSQHTFTTRTGAIVNWEWEYTRLRFFFILFVVSRVVVEVEVEVVEPR